LNSVLNEDLNDAKKLNALGVRQQRSFAIKSGFNALLDVARTTYNETTNDVHEIVSAYCSKLDKNIRLVFNSVSSYTMTCPADSVTEEDLAADFIGISKKKRFYHFTSMPLVINQAIHHAK